MDASSPTDNAQLGSHVRSSSPPRASLDVDERQHNRQKRKRTSPEDQAYLEAAYQRDPKPDKEARLDLVRHVALGEKEVQIWFQNRRQSSRRKSRPLLPHEIAQYQLSRLASNAMSGSSSPPQDAFLPAMQTPSCVLSQRRASLDLSTEATNQVPRHISETSPSERPVATIVREVSQKDPRPLEPSIPGIEAELPAKSTSLRPDEATTAPDLASATLSHEITAEQKLRLPRLPALPTSASQPQDRLRKASSYVRLSTSFDGSASVVTKDGSSPSPPRPGQGTAPAPLEGQHTSPESMSVSSFNSRVGLQRASSGRSRDSRAWEFWCDKDSRNELEVQAERDSSGSAASAIGLLRSTSGRNILGPLPSKRNETVFERPTHGKRPKIEHKKLSPLQRANTSLGRLLATERRKKVESTPALKHAGPMASFRIAGNDSDKENWSPHSESYDTVTNRSRSKSLVTDVEFGRLEGERNQLAKRLHARTENEENVNPEDDPEVAAFMRSGRQSNSASSEADLDCVQGLLSLSQGNWK